MNPTMIEILTRPCSYCGDRSTLSVDFARYQRWVQGATVQRAFPDLDANTRELLVTGTHPECWDNMFPEEV